MVGVAKLGPRDGVIAVAWRAVSGGRIREETAVELSQRFDEPELTFDQARRILESAGATESLVRRGIMALTLVFGAIGIISLMTPDGSAGSPPRMIVMVVLVCSTVPTAAVVRRLRLGTAWWNGSHAPNRLSNGFVIYADVGFAIALGTVQNALVALAVSALYAIIGGYVAYFVTTRMVVLHTIFSSTVIVTIAIVAICTGTNPVTACYLAVVALVCANGLVLLLRVYSLIFQRAMKIQANWSITDSLTGVLNRRGVGSALRGIGARSDLPIAVALVDLDRYKTVNDRYGHGVGDDVLIRIARRIEGVAGPRAVVGRLGGDEFVVAVPIRWEEFEPWLRRLNNIEVDLPDGARLTVSVGASFCETAPPACQNAAEAYASAILREADAALLSAKAAGRNTYVFVQSTAFTEPESDDG